MKITYHKNPLYTTIELDEHEKREFWYKIKIDEMKDLLFSAHFYLSEKEFINLDKAKLELDPDYYFEEEKGKKSKLDQRIDQLFNAYISDLMGPHIGDCTCVPCSCSKCFAESLLGIDTIPGLYKHEASKINSAFGKDNEKTIDEAIITLENYEAKADWKGWEAHIPRWKKEAENALTWLKNYRSIRFKGE